MKKIEKTAGAVNGSANSFKDFLKQCYFNVLKGWHWFMKTFF